MAKLDFDTKSGIYLASNLDNQRREKHDIAIYSLNLINKISMNKFNEKVYDGSFEDEYRNEIAQAIMIFNKDLLDI